MAGKKDIWKYAKGFDKNPQNINKTGANRKSFTTFNIKCKEKNIEPLTKKDYYKAITYLMNLTEEEITEEFNDKNNPQWMRWLISSMRDIKTRDKVMSDYRDWCFGKAKQEIEHSGTVETDINITIDGIDIKDTVDGIEEE